MKLEHISAVLRPRTDAEAVDLGLAMVRRHAGGIYKAWFCLLVPLWGLLGVVFHGNPSLMVAIVWWLKPLYDRVVLFYLGRALFGAAPGLREQVREWPRLLTKRLGLSLLWGRLSGVRSFTMPVVVLEGLKGKVYQNRTAVLKRHGGGAAFGFLQIFGMLEMAVVLGLWFGIRDYLPEEYGEWMANIRMTLGQHLPPPQGLLWSVAACYLVGVAVMEPFYAGGGFGLYINSRTHLEGWDVDLAFRQLGNRLNAARPASVLPPVLILIGLLSWAGMAPSAAAPPVDRAQASRQIKEVLAHPDFTEQVEKNKVWVPDPTTPSPPSPEPGGWDWGWLTGVRDALRNFFSGDWKEVAWRLTQALLLAGLLGWILWLIWKHHRSLRLRLPAFEKKVGPRTVLGMEITPESLPPDVPSAAWSAWQQGDREGAVRLLYRASLTWLSRHSPVLVRESDTEGDCLRHAAYLREAMPRSYFAEITATWLASAYGRSLPEEPFMLGLCQRWPYADPGKDPGNPGNRTPAGWVAMVLCCMVVLTGCNGHWEVKEKEIGYQGEAKRNPWLAASRFLDMNGVPAMEHRGLVELPETESVMILPAAVLQSRASAAHLLKWVKQGGHLIYLAEGGESYLDDWAGYNESGAIGEDLHPLPAQLGIKLKERAAGNRISEVRLDGEAYRVSFQENLVFDTTESVRHPDIIAGPPEAAALVSLRQGQGRVTLMAHAQALRNRHIDDDDHAALLLVLAGLTEPVDQVYFMKVAKISLLDMLMEHAWPVLLALAVLLVVWLWRVLPRFGPVRALSQRRERRFVTHLDEAGAFLWSHRLTDALLEAPRQAVLAAARRRALRPEEHHFIALLATHAGLPAERVTEALLAGAASEARALTRQMADLQQILTSLKQAV